MIWQTLAAVRDLRRLHEIASVLVRFGFGDIVRRLGLSNFLEQAGRALHFREVGGFAHMTPPERVRRALEELGPTFVKLGQVLATRVDLLDPEWIAELGKLQDHAPAAPWTAVERQLTEDLGGAPETVFAHFDARPLAAGSIAQVHRARLEDGTEVVVKVRRPGIRPVLEADLRWIGRLADLAESESPELRALHPREIVRHFSQSLRSELDFATECRNAERIARNFIGYTDEDSPSPLPIVVVPRVHWQWTGERVCVQDFIDGISARRLDALDKAGLDRRLLARRGAGAVLKMIVEDGLFHADPHPGNVFYLPDNRIAFIDFGMVGRLSEERRDQLMRVLLGLARNDARSVADVMVEWANDGKVDEQDLMREIQACVDRYHGVPLKQLRISEVLSDLVAIPRQHHLVLPQDLALLVKAFVSLEGLGRDLDPDFDMASHARRQLEQAMSARYAPRMLVRRGTRVAEEMITLLSGMPRDLSRLLRTARRGRLEMAIDLTHLKRVGDQLDNAANRLVIGIVVAALIVGSSIVMTVPGGPTLFGLPLFGLVGFLGAGVGGLWLLISILRTGRNR